VSIVTIKGTNTALELIANVSVKTKGYNDVVDPLKLTKNFNFVLQNSMIATEVTTQMFLHKSMKFKHEGNAKESSCLREVGNVTKESTITFEYVIEDKEKLAGLKQVPFQIQIKYTKLNGAKCLRVLSKAAETTDKRDEAEQHVNVGIIGMHSHLQAARLASEGNYTKARMVQKANMRMVRRALKSPAATDIQQHQYSLWNTEAVRLNEAIKTTKIEEDIEGLDYHSACDDHSDGEVQERVQEEKEEEEKQDKKKLKEDRKKERKVRRTQNDALSNVLYQAQNPIYSAFISEENALYQDE